MRRASTPNTRATPSQAGSTRAIANWKKIFAAGRFLSLASIQAKAAPAQLLVKNQYLVGKKLNNGAFGQLRLGRDLHYRSNRSSQTNSPLSAPSAAAAAAAGNDGDDLVAIKLESANTRIPMLGLEFRFYKILAPQRGLPRVFHYGPCGKYNALVMELLGPNLEELFTACGKQFSLQTILLIAIQLLNRVEYIHSHGIIYRDIKPENCCIGRSSRGKANIVHLVDFGLAKEFVDPDTGDHIPYSEEKSLTGTVRYMSLNAHNGKEQSRRDDLEALGHVFFYFLNKGHLPWQGVKCDDLRKRYHIIGRIKEETKISEIGNPHPWEFSLYLRYCRSLKFSQTPDYSYLRNLFRSCLLMNGGSEDLRFDWEEVAPNRGSSLARMNSKANFMTNNIIQQPPHNNNKMGMLDEALAICMERSKSNESVILTRTSSRRSKRSENSRATRIERAGGPQRRQMPGVIQVQQQQQQHLIHTAVEILQQKQQLLQASPQQQAPRVSSDTTVELLVPHPLRAERSGSKPTATVEPLPRQEKGLLSPQWRREQEKQQQPKRRGQQREQREQRDSSGDVRQGREEEGAAAAAAAAAPQRVEVVNCKTCCTLGRIGRRMSMKW